MSESQKAYYDEGVGVYCFTCPHCNLAVQVERNQVNCRIFRHGFYFRKEADGSITLLSQMNPHEGQAECERLFREGLIYGCGKPFLMEPNANTYIVKECDYI
jgi:hypothetical protein